MLHETRASTSQRRSPSAEKAKIQHEGEKQELNTLNERFGNYLSKIKSLVHINAQLRRQVDEAYRKYIGHAEGIEQHPSEGQLAQLRQQINEGVRAQTSIQIRWQRAEYDVKFYRKNLKLFAVHEQQRSEQLRTIQQQLDGNLQELEQLQQEYQRREHDLQVTEKTLKRREVSLFCLDLSI